MTGTKQVFQVWAVPLQTRNEGTLSGVPGFDALLGDKDPYREFEGLLAPALDWFRYGMGLYFVYTDKNDDFWRTRLVPVVEQLLLFPVVEPICGKMDKKFWRWLRDVLQFCTLERGDRIFVWPAGKPENAVAGEITDFTPTGRPSINFEDPMQAFPLDGALEFGREHPVADKPSEEKVLPEPKAEE